MKKFTAAARFLTSLLHGLDQTWLVALLGIVRRIVVSVESFRKNEITPRSVEQFEQRLERLARELVRFVLERTLNCLESARRPPAVTREHRTFHPDRRSFRSVETRSGTVRYQRWIFTAVLSLLVRGLHPWICDQEFSPNGSVRVWHTNLAALLPTCHSSPPCSSFANSSTSTSPSLPGVEPSTT